ncbi:hypothetical protein AS156_34700 [Bradyrhizobium macuxiense]|uniref:DUF3551 domain-containing protein n=2 Tax=Bradyrhizobium macuxiense TaxID=1755647 RepID=A0A109K0P1_9BRAD|nr:DUF3551 domain-containing protein [Bradyrhizobium macuxiense]KWV58349.1 hypothetical protein AS156_34700 [Bradyrhizobium macuxiense]
MRRLAPLALAFMLSVTAFAVSTDAASAAKYCLQGRHWGFPGNCAFHTRAQCMASASGTFATCGINPHYAFARQRGRSTRSY